MLPVGLFEWKYAIVFKNNLKTFETKILKIFKNIQFQPTDLYVIIKKINIILLFNAFFKFKQEKQVSLFKEAYNFNLKIL